MEKEPDMDKMVKELMAEASLKKSMQDLIVITLCSVLLIKTKHDSKLFAQAQKKVIKTLKPMSIYQEYMRRMLTEN